MNSHTLLAASLISLSLCLTALWGCATARYVAMDAHGGVIAMPANLGMHREKADELMRGKCPNGYAIVSEGEVAVGEQTTVNRHHNKYGQQTYTTAQTRTQTEWRITFQCR